ncbi:hypothetical protein ISN44_As12g031510 [Arabidopsis suecica]|uniref:Uncharacterized protein n=1 Tax=Arabidopsis suecica TaxID=45249 RepID=A0A8T1YP59_ARASU|nr:hypothetical protein ISN44_As12g031510 [Arabidopsis suecica]
MQRTSEEYNSQEQHDKQKRKFPSLKYKSLVFQNDIPLTGRLGLTCSSPYFKVSYTKLITKLSEIIQAVDMSWTYQIRTKLCQVSFCLSFSYSRFYSLRNLVNIENQKLTLGKDNEKSYARNVLFSHVPPCLKSERITCKQEESFFMSRKHEYFCVHVVKKTREEWKN